MTRPITLALEKLARHRTDHEVTAAPVWFSIAMIALAFPAMTAGWLLHSIGLMCLALGYALLAFAADVYAALRDRKAAR